jgi:hypothetical protein
MLVSVIAKHCPKLELLAVWVDNLKEIIELIKECKKLRGLVLMNYYEKNLDKFEFLNVLCNDASNQLRKLELNAWKFSKETLNDFF